MPEELLTIGEVAARTGVTTSALRYYDQLGLVRPRRRAAGQRRYGPEAIATVAVVLLFREIGFPLAEIKHLLATRARFPQAWRESARRKLDQLDAQIAKAAAARHAIEHSLHCPKDDILACPMLVKLLISAVSLPQWPRPITAVQPAGPGARQVEGWLLACPPGVDDHVVADAAGDVVVQAEADDAVIAGVERPERVFAQDRAERIDEGFPKGGPVVPGPGRHRNLQPRGSRPDRRHVGMHEPSWSSCFHAVRS
jgi:MerR family redox-sensitive transcriptional activator SoxR